MNDYEFKRQYATLNKKQKEAVDTIEGPVMVIAGPGTGKTTILTLRIANILKQTDTPADGILALTFTDSGVKAMRSKLREIIGTTADEVRIHTFHSFASSVITEFDDHFPHIARAKQITDIEAEEIIRSLLRDVKFSKLRPLGDPEHYVGKILRTIQECKKEAWTPEMIESYAKEEIERIKDDPTSLSTRGATKGKLKADAVLRIEKCEKTALFAQAYKLYEDKKKQEKKIDYDDLIFELLLAFKEDETLLRMLQEKFLYILVDEHQDTNDAQNLLVKNLADFFDNPNLFVVGDEKQAIYRFQGASVENFLRFQDIWKSMRIIKLEDNYRSHQSLLDTSFSLIEKNYADGEHENLRVRLKAGGEANAKKIDVVTAGNQEAAERYLVAELKALSSLLPNESIAVIARTNREVERIMAVLDDEGIEASAERGADIFSHPAGNLYFELLEFLNDSSLTESLAYTIAGGMWHLDFSQRLNLIKAIKSGDYSKIESEIPDLKILLDELNNSSPVVFLIRVAEVSGFLELVVENPLSTEVWRGIVALAQDLVYRGSIEDPRMLIAELLNYRASAETKSIKIFGGKNNANIRVMTAHSSKGLEFDYVFIPNAVEEIWLPRARGSSFVLPRESDDSSGVKDARRLFYVALTRAKKHAVITAGLENSLGRSLTSLRFLDELDQDHVSNINISAMPLSLDKKKWSSKEKSHIEVLEYTKHILTEKGLSVTALNHFLTCPNKFIYQSILKVPEAVSASSEKGNAMHDAISRVWKGKINSTKGIEVCMEDSIRSYFQSSSLPKLEKELALNELLDSLPHVASELTRHFQSTGTVLTEAWVEVPYKFKDKKGEIVVNLHGKLDTIIDDGESVSVYDYKTRAKMSVAEIKGETKDSDGSYFRQLVFYKILMSENPKFKSKKIETSLIFVKPDNKGQCQSVTLEVEESDVERVKKEISSLISSVWSGEILQNNCEDKDCKWCGLRDL
jgi:DNA helicase II / ATP-dependent DNA helicase PcrA